MLRGNWWHFWWQSQAETADCGGQSRKNGRVGIRGVGRNRTSTDGGGQASGPLKVTCSTN
jgi:hypothetical protein